MHVTDLQGHQYVAQVTTTNDYELNGNQNISADILPTKVNKLFIDNISELWTITDHDDVEHKIIYAKKQGRGDRSLVSIKATPLFFDDFDNQRVERRVDQHMTATNFFNFVFYEPDYQGNPSSYTYVLNGNFDSLEWEGLGEGETRLESFKRGLNRYGAEFRIVGKVIYIEKQIGNDTQHMYRHKLNASNIVKEIDGSELWTYAKGYGDYGDGDGGEDWQNAKLIREYTSPLANILGIRHAPPIKNGNITVQSQMDSQLKILVDESLKISITADIHDLRKQGYPIAQSNLGDRVFVIDERIGLDEEVRVVNKSITRDWKGNILDINLTFGSEGLTKRHQSNLNTAMKDITALLEGRRTLPFDVFDQSMKNAVNAIKNAQTELTFDNGIWGIDPTNPNYVTGMTSRGFMVSVDGGATAEVAITGEGINGNVIMSKTILADSIYVNRLSALATDTGMLEVTDDILLTEVNKGIYMSFENLDIPTGGSLQRLMSGTGRMAKHQVRWTGRFKEDSKAWRNADTLIGLDHILLREYFRNADGTNGNMTYRTDFTAENLFMTNVGSGVANPQQYTKMNYDNIEIKNFTQHAFYRGNMIRVDGPEYSIDGANNESFFRFINGETARIVRSTRIAANQSSASGGFPVYVSQNNNNLYVSTSSEKYKINIERGEKESDLRLLEVPVARWNDKQSAEYMAELLTDEYEGKRVDWNSDERAILVDNLERSVGFIAEDMFDLGLLDYLIFDGDLKTRENIITIQYDRLVVPLLAIVQRQQKQIDKISGVLNNGRID